MHQPSIVGRSRGMSFLVCACALLAFPVHAQTRAEIAASVQEELGGWRRAHGERWRAELDPAHGRVELLYGGRAEGAGANDDDATLARVALRVIERTRALTGVESSTLELERVVFLPLGLAGSVDKRTVRFTQSRAGVPVEDGTVDVLFDARGALLSVFSRALPDLTRASMDVVVDAELARTLAAQEFARTHGLVASELSAAELRFARGADGEARLTWRVEARASRLELVPIGEAFFVDTRDGRVLAREATIHELEVRGNVRTNASPGVAPDTSGNPEAFQPARWLRAESSQGDVLTDAAGNFVFPGVDAPLQVTFRYAGPFNNVQNVAGSEHSVTVTLQPNVDQQVTLNSSSSSQVTAQANAFQSVNRLRDWIRSVIPTDDKADFVARANVNLSQTCNAYYDGSSTNYFLAGGSCTNTSYSTVVAHEMGHWLNDRYGTGNGADGIGEGNADVFAMYSYDTPIVGQDFCGTGCHIRNGNNLRQFCGDDAPACHGEVHADGEVWMGVTWKIRAALQQAHGTALGGQTADTLFLSWMNAYNQGAIRSIMEAQWLTLDDDDGDLNNGSPNYAQIDGAFRVQGFPGVELNPITFSQVDVPGDQSIEGGVYPVDVRATAHFVGASITSVVLHHRIDGGAWQNDTLLPQGGGLRSWFIDAVPSPSLVELYLVASDDQSHVLSWPAGGAASPHRFRVGASLPFYEEGFEASDGNFTHGTYGDTANPADDFQWGQPAGRGGQSFQGAQVLSWTDPATPYSGDHVIGNDLGNSSDGAYPNSVHCWLRSPPIDCTGRTNVRLRFQRWLTTHRASTDQARVRVNGTIVWQNSSSTAHIDGAWTLHEIDIQALADLQPSVVIEFELQTNGSNVMGGWTIDDVQLVALAPALTGCLPPLGFGPGKLSSSGLAPLLAIDGETTLTAGAFDLFLQSGPPNVAAVVYSSPILQPSGLLGGVFFLGSPYQRVVPWTLNSFGDASASIPVWPSMVGTRRYYQALLRDPASPDGTGMVLSRAVRADFCP